MDQAVTEQLFHRVTPDDVPAHWPAVERGIAAILAKCPKEPWTARDIRRHLRLGHAGLFVREDGFIVVERRNEPISGEPYLNVWLMWFEPGKMNRDAIAAWLDEMVRQTRSEWWQFTSPRNGWGQALEGCCERIGATWGRR